MRVFTLSHDVCKARSRKVSRLVPLKLNLPQDQCTCGSSVSLSVKDFKAPEYNFHFVVFRLMPSKVAISNGTGASGKDNSLSILIVALYYCEFAVRRPKMPH